MELSAGQISRLNRAQKEISAVLIELGASPEAAAPGVPRWKADTEKQWSLLKAVRERGGDLGSDEWGALGASHGYDPRGLGGFFRGAEQLMASQGERRVLTEHGRRFIERWERDFVRAP
jgi:hypothetical protein